MTKINGYKILDYRFTGKGPLSVASTVPEIARGRKRGYIFQMTKLVPQPIAPDGDWRYSFVPDMLHGLWIAVFITPVSREENDLSLGKRTAWPGREAGGSAAAKPRGRSRFPVSRE